MRRIVGVLASALCLFGVLAAAPATAGPKPAAAPQVTSSPAAYSCPVGDGPASWGKAKLCSDPVGGRVHMQDSLTDGYCVFIRTYAAESNSWVQTGPKACTTGQWVTFTASISKLCYPTARLYRENGSYFTLPETAC